MQIYLSPHSLCIAILIFGINDYPLSAYQISASAHTKQHSCMLLTENNLILYGFVSIYSIVRCDSEKREREKIDIQCDEL